MKKLLSLLILLASISVASAKSVVFTLSDGTLVYYLLGGDVSPMLRFNDGNITVNTDTYELSGIKNFYISESDDPTGVQDVQANRNSSYVGNTFIINSVGQVKVYGINGAEVDVPVNESNGYTSVDLSGLQKGAYVISVGSSSFKILKK